MKKALQSMVLAAALFLFPARLGWATDGILDEFKSFLASQWEPPRVEETLKAASLMKDERCGYLQASVEHEASTTVYTFTFWNRGGDPKSRLYGFSAATDGMEGDSYETSFWTHDQGGWTEQKDVIPRLELKDFWDGGAPLPDAAYRQYVQFEFALPRSGTTIRVRVRPFAPLRLGEVADQSPGGPALPEGDAYEKMLAHLTKTTLDLVWDKKAGKFKKGPKTVAK